MTRGRSTRIFWIGAAAILVVAALIAIGAVIRGDLSDRDGRILVSLAAVLYTGGAAVAGLTLSERGPARLVGRIVAVLAGCSLLASLVAIWSFVWESDNANPERAAWSAIIVVGAGLIATVALLLARGAALVRLAAVAGILAGLAATLSVIAIWVDDWDRLVKAIAATWILAGLAFLLVPILQRFTSAGRPLSGSRVVASLGDVDAVAIRGAAAEGDVAVAGLEAGEQLVLRSSRRVAR